MPTVADLADAYRVLQAQQDDLDHRIQAMEQDDLEGRDALMTELEFVVTDLNDTVRQLVREQAHNLTTLRSKAMIIAANNACVDGDLLHALGRSLARDVAALYEQFCGEQRRDQRR